MQSQTKLSTIFQDEPVRWGFRGDPYLWREMKATVDDYEYPDIEEQFTALLEQMYERLTGASLTDHEPIFVERYSHGGMSSGYVSPQFWVEQAIPMLLKRYRESK
ncbi:MAG TPA: hypothetical protein VMN99_03775 [Anaerolineales bacterium]|nr:hypothetical protein [Anaerolineales bacterium]